MRMIQEYRYVDNSKDVNCVSLKVLHFFFAPSFSIK